MATEYKLGYTGEEINKRLATVNETRDNLANNYYTSAQVDTKMGDKADLVDGKVPAEQLPTIVEDYLSLNNKLGDIVALEEVVDIVVGELPKGEALTSALYQFADYYGFDSIVTEGQVVYMYVTKSDGEEICIGEGSLYRDTTLESLTGNAGNYAMYGCTINSTEKNLSQLIQTGELPYENTQIPYSFAVVFQHPVVNPSENWVFFVAADNYHGVPIRLTTKQVVSTCIKLPNEALTFDEVPTENSENLVTSGVIHAALQNVGGTDLVAGDFIEIKDGVVRCTLGDLKSGEIKEEFEETYGTHTLEMTNEEGLYLAEIPMNEYGLPSVGDVLEVVFTPSGETTLTNFSVEATPLMIEDGEVYIWTAACNATLTLDMEFTVIDDTKPAFVLLFQYLDRDLDAPVMMVASTTDYTSGTLTIGYKTVTEKKEYVLLPDTALGLGKEIMAEVDEEILNVEIPEMENMETAYMGMFENSYGELSVGEVLDVDITLPNENFSTTLTSEIMNFVIAEEMSMPIASFNCILSMSEETGTPVVTKLDDSLPAFVVMPIPDDGNPAIQIISADDYTGASIVVSKKVVVKTNVKLPNEALSFDSEPTEGSTNLVNSGDLYNFIGDIESVLDEISALIGE